MTRGLGLRVDPHVKVLDQDVVARAKARDLDALVFAPHFTRLDAIRETAERYTDDDLLVLPAREVFTGTWRNRKHVLALDLESPVPDFIDLSAAFEEFARQDAVVLVPHPTFMTVSLNADDILEFRDAIHGIETYNTKHLPTHNRRARSLAARHRLPVYASSYAHLPGTVGEVWTSFEDVEPTERDIIQAFRAGTPRTVGRRTGAVHRLRCLAEFGHLFYENTLEKFDRVVLSGTEATHPRRPAYRDRFEVATDGT